MWNKEGENMKNNVKGITLLSLVITIAILIILSTITITTLNKNNGIIAKAQKAKDYQMNAEASEQKFMQDATDYIDGILNKEENSNTEKEEQEKTLNSFRVLNETYGIYYMEYTSDYKLDEFLASGGAETQEEINDFVSNKLLDGKEVKVSIDEDIFCTTFSAKNESGETLFGRNLDIINDTPVLIAKVIPSNGDYKSISTVHLGMFDDFRNASSYEELETLKYQVLIAPYMPMDGMNEKGLSIGILALNNKFPKKDTGKVNLTIWSFMRLILDKAANVDEAINLIKQYDMSFSGLQIEGHYQITDASGDSIVVEWINGEVNIIRQEKNFQVCSNFYLSPSMSEDDKASGTAKERYNTAYSALDSVSGIIKDEQAMQLLEAVNQGNATKWSVVFNSEKLTAEYAPHNNYEEKNRIKISL